MKRSAGILLPIASLPSCYGIGCFDKSAYEFVDFLKESGQSYWQILPLCPTSYGDSPYQSFSTFAGNPYFIDLSELTEEGLLDRAECEAAGFIDSDEIDYSYLFDNRFPLLKKAYKRSNIAVNQEFISFCEKNEWLSDYALFMALKDNFGGVSWDHWNEDIRLRKADALQKWQIKLADEINFYKFLQHLFFRQWHKLKSYANENGIQIIGDIPIYVAFDSADAWANPKLFQLDENGLPKAVAGCPPDGFAADGQLWGNPLYDWDYHKEEGYSWWISRLSACFELYDVVRIDHFRGFDEYYSIPYGDKTAKNGHWEKGPGIELFRAIEKALGKKDIIAEDLGFMTDSVRQLVKDCGFPNMKVLEFAFDSRDTGSRNDYLPHNYDENCVAYTGTHDNQTIASWFKTITEEERLMAKEYLCDSFTPDDKLNKAFISLIMRSRARLCIIPMQDWLGLDDRSRINIPSTVGENWKWRMKSSDITDLLIEEIYKYTQIFGRAK
ncbi:MAG: 4-alpha-glucanotransferase [Oscillospiraceae bacterium]|nr:4-alpha-glucanotransferase [Oscillospiraceae bacterium]